jgi:tetratricopeptide (TPR) repeat protein
VHRDGKHPQQDARILLAQAEKELAAGAVAAAAALAANALVAAPTLPEAHELLARLTAHPEGGRELFPLDDPLSLATVVARAHVAAAERDFGYALRLLAKAQAFAPTTPWADVPWVTAPATAAETEPAVVATIAVGMLDVLRSHGADAADAVRAAMSPYLRLVRNAIKAHPDHADLLGAAGYFFRRFDLTEAAGYAARADELAPCRASANAIALIRIDQGRTDEALHVYERALTYEPDNPEAYADICELLLNADRLDEALGYARRGLAIDPGHVCCQVSALAAQFRQTRQAEYFDALIALYQAQPGESHASRHAASTLQAVVTKTAARSVTLRGSGRQVLKATRRTLRSWSQ